MSKKRRFWIPSVDTEPAKLIYKTEKEALNYAMKKSSMSCGAIEVIEISAVKELIDALKFYGHKVMAFEIGDGAAEHGKLAREALKEWEEN